MKAKILHNALLLLIGLCEVSSLSSCANPPGDAPRLAPVEPLRIYRLAQPTLEGYVQLSKLGIVSVVKLNTEELDQERAWAKATGIRLIELPISGLFAPTTEQANAIQAAIRDPRNQPVAFHCTQGEDRTGMVAAIYRHEVQGWTTFDAWREWRKLGHSPFLFTMDWFFFTRYSHEPSRSLATDTH